MMRDGISRHTQNMVRIKNLFEVLLLMRYLITQKEMKKQRTLTTIGRKSELILKKIEMILPKISQSVYKNYVCVQNLQSVRYETTSVIKESSKRQAQYCVRPK